LRTHSLVSNFSLITAISNDITNDQIFSFQISQYARAGDVALFVSSSGKSPNILYAIETAKHLGLETIGISGNAGGNMSNLCKYNLFVNSSDTQIIEDTHNVFGHLILNHFSGKFGI
jgi:D-sedoheptulose 7-phosphate isomerase